MEGEQDDLKKKWIWMLLCMTALFSCPCRAEDTTLPAGSRYKPEKAESHLSEETTGIYLLPGDDKLEVWIDGVKLFAGEARALTGEETMVIVPSSDGCFSSKVSYLLAEKDGGCRRVTLAFSYSRETDNRPEAACCSLTVRAQETATGTLEGSSPLGSVDYILVTKPQKGRVEIEGSTYRYYPYDGVAGKDSFRYAAVDKTGRVSAPARVNLSVGDRAAVCQAVAEPHFKKKQAYLYAVYE